MIIAELAFPILDASSQDADDRISWLLHTMRKNGQLLGRVFPVAYAGDRYLASVMLPESDSLERKYWNVYVSRGIDELQLAGLAEPTVRLIGPDNDSCDPCVCESRSALILFTTYVSLESPLRCFHCFLPVPLYQIPPTHVEEYHDILNWMVDYQACDHLQMNCMVGERFAIRQMSDFKSTLSKQGMEVCGGISAVTNVPTYHYLYRANGQSLAREKDRKCPSCGEKWLLTERLHGFFDFQCDRCRLLSNIALRINNR